MVCSESHATSYQIKNNIFYKSPIFVTDNLLQTIDLYLGKFIKISFFPIGNGKFLAFSTG